MKSWQKKALRTVLDTAVKGIDRQPEVSLNVFNTGIIVNIKQVERKIVEALRKKFVKKVKG